jgi:hypothetical protein
MKAIYRIITKEGNVKFAGTDFPSWLTLDRARENAEDGDKIYEFDTATMRQMWEVC